MASDPTTRTTPPDAEIESVAPLGAAPTQPATARAGKRESELQPGKPREEELPAAELSPNRGMPSFVPRPQRQRPLAPRRKKRRIVHENSVLLLALAAGAVGVVTSLVLLWTGDYTSKTQWTLALFIVGAWLGF